MNDSTYHIVGEVIEVNTVPNPLNFNRTNITQILVKDKSGDTYYGTFPVVSTSVEMGDRVKFIADIRQSQHYETKFLFKNARKMSVESYDANS